MSARIGHPVEWEDLRVGDQVRFVNRDFGIVEDTITAVGGDVAELQQNGMLHRAAAPVLLAPGPNHTAPIAPPKEIQGTRTKAETEPEPTREEPTMSKKKRGGYRGPRLTAEEKDHRTELALLTHRLRRDGLTTAAAVRSIVEESDLPGAAAWTPKMYSNHQLRHGPKYADWLADNPEPAGSPKKRNPYYPCDLPSARDLQDHRKGPAAAVQKAGEQAAQEKERAYAKGVLYAAKRALAETPGGGSYWDTIVEIVHDEDHDWARHGGPPEPGEVMDRLQELRAQVVGYAPRDVAKGEPFELNMFSPVSADTDEFDALMQHAADVRTRVIARAEKIAADLATHIQALGATLAVARAFLRETDGETAA